MSRTEKKTSFNYFGAELDEGKKERAGNSSRPVEQGKRESRELLGIRPSGWCYHI
jgi:hypothetical protein